MKMYFLAIVSPAEIHGKVLKWKEMMHDRFGCTVALRSPAHITLIPPFWMDELMEPVLLNIIDDFASRQKGFEIQLRDFAAFKPRVIYVDLLPNALLMEMHKALVDHFTNSTPIPIEKEERPFHPHVTIATRDLHKKAFHEAWEIFKSKKYEASWWVNGISLLRHNQKNWDVVHTSQFKK